ncbi:extracellular solute-binding protein [Paenibacillus sp. LMG 31461]|uniref:Extracellular solute-binding protein n=1 Tax=Paenibacillus plantarum TaxID=2654975 RepID=A0ABX1XCF3_9BACL|nr:extracellular solute-binding protein [Paenibacillus plantarum]NOU66160.1 extracellular solute-binding protein [Paenibacillus plantarum]
MQNNTSKKKWTAMLLMALTVSSLMAGCSGNNNTAEPKDSSNTDGSGNKQSATGGSKSDVGYPAQMSYWAPLDGNVAATLKNYNDIGMYKKLQELTGTKVEFKHPSADSTQALEQFNLMLASKNLPDVIEYTWTEVSGGPENAVQTGTILKLNDLIDKYAPNFKKYLQEHPDIAKMIKTDTGSIYSFPFIRGDSKLMVFYGPIFRKDWLDKVHMDAPTTIDEWEKVLMAFRDQDPNGNGQKDEIPFLLKYNEVRDVTRNSLIGAWGIGAQFYQVDGKVKYGEIQPEFKQFLTTMRKWYKEGLIDPDFAATDAKLMDAKVTGNKLGTFYGLSGGNLGNYLGLMKDKNPSFNLVAAAHPTLKNGATPVLGQMDKPYKGLGAAISGKAKDPEQIVKWLDYAYSEEGHLLYNFGVEGKTYDMVNGYPTYTKLITENTNGLSMVRSMAQWMRANYNGPFVQDKRYVEQYYNLDQQKNALNTWSKAENAILMPPLTLTAEENKRFSSIMNDVNTYAGEMGLKFIMGNEPLDNFDKFVDTLKKFGIDEAVKIQQAALDRYKAR